MLWNRGWFHPEEHFSMFNQAKLETLLNTVSKVRPEGAQSWRSKSCASHSCARNPQSGWSLQLGGGAAVQQLWIPRWRERRRERWRERELCGPSPQCKSSWAGLKIPQNQLFKRERIHYQQRININDVLITYIYMLTLEADINWKIWKIKV